MTAALEVGEWSAARSGRTLPPEKTRYSLYRRLGGTQGRFGRAENHAPPGFDPPNRPARCQSLYRLTYPLRTHTHTHTHTHTYICMCVCVCVCVCVYEINIISDNILNNSSTETVTWRWFWLMISVQHSLLYVTPDASLFPQTGHKTSYYEVMLRRKSGRGERMLYVRIQ